MPKSSPAEIRFKKAENMLARAEAAYKAGRKFTNQQIKKIGQEYTAAKQAYKNEAAGVDQRARIVSDTVERISPVNDNELKAVYKEFGLDGNMRGQSVGVQRQLESLPKPPTHMPTPAAVKPTASQPSVQGAKRSAGEAGFTTPVSTKQQRIEPSPQQGQIDALARQKQQFEANFAKLTSITPEKSTKAELMAALRPVVAAIDSANNTQSMAYYKKLEARMEDLSHQMSWIQKLRALPADKARPGAIAKAMEQFNKDNVALKKDLNAFKTRVIGVCRNSTLSPDSKYDEKIAALKQVSVAGAEQPEDAKYSSPRPR